jgi:anti-sigma regulatory factor (Ser/Thr protein kinase)
VKAPRRGARRTLAELSVSSEPGNERRAMEEVAAVVSGLGLPDRTLEKLKTAVAEATMNAMEHGNHYQADLPVLIEVSASDTDLSVKITEGWGLFLIKSMVDEMKVTGDEHHHTVELVMHLEGGDDAR